MASRRFLFEGDDAQYIRFLEDIVQRSGLVPPLAPSTQKDGNDPQPCEHLRGIDTHTPPASEDERTASQELQIIQIDPSKNRSGSRTRPNTERWKKELDEFIGRVCDINNLELRRKELGLGDNQAVITSLIKGFAFADDRLNTSDFSLSDSSLLRTLSNYAQFTKKSTDVLSCLAHFRDLVFVSFCDVVLGCGEGKDKVHDAMRLYISDSSGQNLDKIISGSRWVNRCIANLSKTYWGLRSSEIFVVNGQTLNFYGRYAACGYESEPYIMARLWKQDGSRSGSYPHGRIPIIIPCIIKLLVGNALDLAVISDILGYDRNCTLEWFRQYYAGRFSNHHITSFSFPSLNERNPKRKRDHMSKSQANKRNGTQRSPRQEEPDGGSNRVPDNLVISYTRPSNHDARPADGTALVELTGGQQGESNSPDALFTTYSQDGDTQRTGVDPVHDALPSAPCPGAEQFVDLAQHQTTEPHYPSVFLGDGNLPQVAHPLQTAYTYDFYNFLSTSPDWNSVGYDFSSNFR
ncbi:hypothetical protein KXX44_008951 [Aspergillus fumigatus]|nr:hypothetical protein KXX44_008951 [Aspergillus fumigatus]KAH1837541.1 hypothetical protein KXX55_005951 [Aspergillus fumigatus]KAH2441426.1 hypothetical protein KXV83_004453 [Aspergillus fumigatus]KAH2976536.1 hypothetical protein KXW58_006749 [Aspergillus fumigatus]KAH3034184.1 hypothetical protein KXW01_006411 [Aspergillus fumigatus]